MFTAALGKLGIKVHKGFCLVVVDLQALEDDIFMVVFALHEIFARHIVLARNLRRVVLDVIGAAARRVHAASGHALNDFSVRHADFKNVVNRNAGVDQGASLRNCAGKPSKRAPLAQSG